MRQVPAYWASTRYKVGNSKTSLSLRSCSRQQYRHPPATSSQGINPLRSNLSVRKEVIQPQVPLRLPCYDLVPITELAFDVVLPKVEQNGFEHSPLSWLDGRCVQGSGTYSPRRS
jgi:hypothetical protein